MHRRPEGYRQVISQLDAHCIGPECQKTDHYCVAACPQQALSISDNPSFATLGDCRWTPDLIVGACGKWQRDGPSAESALGERDGRLRRRLLEEFGPPRKTSPAYPFNITWPPTGCGPSSTASGPGSPGASVTALRAQHAAGQLDPGLAESLRAEPLLLAQLARAVLDANFEPSLHEDICAAATWTWRRRTPRPEGKECCAGVTREELRSS